MDIDPCSSHFSICQRLAAHEPNWIRVCVATNRVSLSLHLRFRFCFCPISQRLVKKKEKRAWAQEEITEGDNAARSRHSPPHAACRPGRVRWCVAWRPPPRRPAGRDATFLFLPPAIALAGCRAGGESASPMSSGFPSPPPVALPFPSSNGWSWRPRASRHARCTWALYAWA